MRRSTISIFALTLIAGCGESPTTSVTNNPVKVVSSTVNTPVLRLVNSDYPSWLTFQVAVKLRLIDPAKGKMGSLEQKHDVDLVLQKADYTKSIEIYGTGSADALCVTNTDVLAPALSRPTVALFPTSTSQGADALVVFGVNDVKDLKGMTVVGAAKCVSEFAFYDILTPYGLGPKDVTFKDMETSLAKTAFVNDKSGVPVAAMLYEPFVQEALAKRKGSKVLISSKTTPMRVIDMVVMSQEYYDSPNGPAGSALLGDVFYTTCAAIKSSDTALALLGEEFFDTDLKTMKVIHNPQDPTQSTCRFFDAPEQGIAVFTDAQFPKSLQAITDFSLDREIITKSPSVKFASSTEKINARTTPNLTFTSDVMKNLVK